jgi:hypothetical protein
MKTIFIVKSFGHQGYLNLRAFDHESEAENFAEKVKSHIPLEILASGDEFVEIEELPLEEC